MNSKNLFLIVILIMSFMNVTAQNENEPLDSLIEHAIRVSPKIKLLRSKMDVSKAKIEKGTNLPDPTLTLGLINMPTNSFSFKQEPMTGKIIGITQAFPFPGGLGSKSNVIAIDTLIVKQEIEDYKNEIRKDVATLYYDLKLVREEIILTSESKVLLDQISEVVKSKYKVSKVSLQNLVQVEVQMTRVQDKIESLIGKENATLAELNVFLLMEENSPIDTDEIIPVSGDKYSSTALIKTANEYRPFLKGIELSEQKSKLMEDAADYSYYPNFQIGLQYTQRDYSSITGQNWNDFLSVVVGITLPLGYGGGYSSKVEEAQYLQSFYREQYSYSVQSLNQSFGKIVAKLNELQIREKLISGTLLPQAHHLLQASLLDYQVGNVDFVNVINAENDILKIKTDLIKIRTEYSKNIAQLEFLVGKEFNDNNKKDNARLRLDKNETSPSHKKGGQARQGEIR
ncbi:MAG: TolC family protein [Bacteroidota bacterium]